MVAPEIETLQAFGHPGKAEDCMELSRFGRACSECACTAASAWVGCRVSRASPLYDGLLGDLTVYGEGDPSVGSDEAKEGEYW